MKHLIIPAICILIGCVGGATLPAVHAQTFGPPAPSTQRWEQFCEPNGSRGTRNSALMRNARARGEQGFELVALGSGWNTLMACYKRPAQ